MLANINANDRVESAKRSGLEQSIEYAERLRREPWPISITSRTSADEQYEERNLVFELENLHEGWGIGTILEIDFGDGSPTLLHHAEKVKQTGVVSHRYSRAGNYALQIKASTDEVSDELLGFGSLKLTIEPSQSVAQVVL